MTHLGSLGKSKSAEPITFEYFGSELTAIAVTDVDYLDFMSEIRGLAVDDPRSHEFIKEFARLCLGEQFDLFWRLSKQHRQSQEDLFETLTTIVEAASGRPTVQPSDSSDGLSSTAQRSTGGSSSLADRLSGRPDLQLMVKEAQDQRAS